MNEFPSPTPQMPLPNRSSQMPGCVSWLVLLVIAGGVAATSYMRHSFILGTSISIDDNTWMYGLIGAGVVFLLLAVPLWLVARFWPDPRHQALYRAWQVANVLNLLLAPVHFLSLTDFQGRMLAQIGVVALLCIGPWLLGRLNRGGAAQAVVRNDPVGGHPVSGAALSDSSAPITATPPAPALAAEELFEAAAHPGRVSDLPAQDPASLDRPLLRWLASGAIGLLMLAPWMARGAQGSPLDTLLALLLAGLLGLYSGLVCEMFIFVPLRRTGGSRAEDFFLAGVGTGGVLLLTASATAFAIGGMQLLLLIALPGLGWALAGLNMLFPGPRSFTRWAYLLGRVAPQTLLVGLAAAGPLVWIDPDELAMVVGMSGGEILGVAFGIAFNDLWLSLALGIAFLAAGAFTARRLNLFTRRVGQIGFLALVALVTVEALIWGFSAGRSTTGSQGRPTFNGERLFVILKDQLPSDGLAPAAQIADPAERRRFVYQALVQHTETTQAGLRASLDNLGIDYTPYYLVNALEVRSEPILRAWLESRPEVDRVLDSPRMRPLPEPLPVRSGYEHSPYGVLWNLSLIHADQVWQEFGVHGEGIVVGQSDSGAQWDHPELAQTYRGTNGEHDYNWYDPWYGTRQPTDTGGHGTHTIGSIAGQSTGVAPGVTWFACANLARNLGNPALYLDCWQFMLAPFPLDGDPFKDGDPVRGANVLNNSWGCPELEGCDINTFLAAAQALRQAGIFVVASAGNDGPACESLNTPPPVYDETFAVGAVDSDGYLAGFSSIGPVTKDGSGRVKPDVVAPGADVLSSLPGNTYGSFSGTSMAGPHVVGVVALMWSANPALVGQVDATAEILRDTAQPYHGSLPNCPGAEDMPSTAVGYGIVDAYAAVQAARAWQP